MLQQPELALAPARRTAVTSTAAPHAVRTSGPLPALVGRINDRLDALLPLGTAQPGSQPNPLAPAMRHAVLGPGKRVRALLALLAGQELHADDGAALDAGCAVEMLHAASLVFDDLPAMDNADTRRGRPSTHAAHGEATAMLAGIGLIAQAFGLVNGLAQLPAEARSAMVGVLARTIGCDGMAAGQLCDVAAVAGTGDLKRVEQVGEQKTGSLFIAAVELGALTAGANAAQRARLCAYAQHIGLAFQIADDLLDVDEDEDAGRDTYVGLLGRCGAVALLRTHLHAARSQLWQPRGGLMQLTECLFAAHLAAEERVA